MAKDGQIGQVNGGWREGGRGSHYLTLGQNNIRPVSEKIFIEG